MPVAAAAHHSVFTSAVRALDVLQRVYMRIVAYVSPVAVCETVFGTRMRCAARDFVQRRVRFFGIFEHSLTFYTLDRLRPGDLYLDIGANVGYFTLLAAQAVGPSGKVIAIEADPETHRLLLENLELNNFRNVDARNVAATESPCRVSVCAEEAHNAGAHTIKVGQGDVEGLPLGTILGADLPHVRFVKVDIEGSERPVLEAILAARDEMRDDLIVASEISANSEDLVARFADSGFRVFAIQNVYTIDYYLLRQYIRRYAEDRNIVMFPVKQHLPPFRDYVFERVAGASG